MMMDDERMAHTFSAVCSPPISMMFKGRGRSSSKLKKMEIVTQQEEELDEEVCDGLLKISKSSEELWKDVYAVFSPPTPIGSKMPDYMPFDSYKHASISTTPPRNTALGDSEAHNNNGQLTALDILSTDTGKTSVIPAMQYYPPNYTPPVLNTKFTNAPGTTVTNSISIQHSQLSNTKVHQLKEENDAPNINSTNSTSTNTNINPNNIAALKRAKRNSREHPFLNPKRPPTRSHSAANINNIINESMEAGEAREDGSPRVPRVRRHNSADNTVHASTQGLHTQTNYNHNSHPHSPLSQQPPELDRTHSPFDNRTANPPVNSHLHMNMHSNAVYTGNTPMLDMTNDHHSSTSTSTNFNHVSSLSHDDSHHMSIHAPNTNNVHYSSNTPNSILTMGNPLSNNDKYWTEVIFSCKKLVALAGAGLANTLSFSELVDGLTLARHITSMTAAAVMNSGGYTPVQPAPVSDEFNRLVTETFGTMGLPQNNPTQNIFNNQTNNFNATFNTHPSHTTNQQNQPSLHINTDSQNNMFPYFSSPPLNGLPSSPPLSYSSSSTPYSPTTYPPAPFSNSAPSTPISTSSSNGINSPPIGSPLCSISPTWSGSSGGAFAFEELRKKLPVPTSIVTKQEEEDSDESIDSPSLSPKSPPLSHHSLVPLSPCLSPGGSSTSSPPVPPEHHVKGEREPRESKVKEREEKTSWKKPRGKKKRPKYEADLECRSCGVRQTPEWRRGPFGAKTLCNACGLHWAKVLKAEGKGDQKRVALLEAKRSQFMMTQKRAHGTRSSRSSSPTIKNEPLHLSPHMSSR